MSTLKRISSVLVSGIVESVFPRVYNWNVRIYTHTYMSYVPNCTLRKTDPVKEIKGTCNNIGIRTIQPK